MKLVGNTILITGGGSGIGRALAEMFYKKGNKVIIAGRSEAKLAKVIAAHEGIESLPLDINDPESIRDFTFSVKNTYPKLNVVIHNAGIMRPETIGENDVDVAEATIMTNLLGQIRLNSALLPLLRKQSEGTIITVSSGLGFLPRADFPTYCATKAALHSYTQSLRRQLKDTELAVIELIPPYVQTKLQGPEQASDSRAMPLKDYINEVATILESEPDVTEVAVERVLFQRTAESSSEYNSRYETFNKRFSV
jgi:uncharacterized oxidoreductase